jgi:hypothetical protein
LSPLRVTIVTLDTMVFPSFAAVVILAHFAPMLIFKVTLGLWPIVKGIPAPIAE